MGHRKPKPTMLKEQTSAKPKLGLTSLFAEARELLPVVFEAPPSAKPSQMSTDDDLELGRAETVALHVPKRAHLASIVNEADDKTLKIADMKTSTTARASAQTAVGEPVREHTSVTKLKANQLKSNQATSKASQAKTLAPKKSGTAIPFALVLLALGGAAYVALDPVVTQVKSTKSQLSSQQIQERLNYHRMTTGTHLNRERIDVQINNHLQAPNLSVEDRKVKAPDMMKGLPLIGESANSPRDKKDLPVNSQHPDARIMYGLQEEQNRIEFEKASQKAWLEEFKQNARREGYDVQVDAYGNVESRKLRPEEYGPVDGQNELPETGN